MEGKENNTDAVCRNCKWFKVVRKTYDDYGILKSRSSSLCFLNPPTINGRPETSPEDTCKEFSK